MSAPTRRGDIFTPGSSGPPPPGRNDGARTTRPGVHARRRSTYVAGDRVTVGDNGALVVREFLTSSGEAELYLTEADTGASPARVPADAPVVLKVYHHGAEPKGSVLALWAGMGGRGVLRLHAHGVLESGRAYEVVEYAAGGSLARHLPITDLARLRGVLADAAEGLNALHARGIVHRDIKPDNLLCRDAGGGDVVVADFGVATVLAGRSLVLSRAGFGTPDYMAPEQGNVLQTGPAGGGDAGGRSLFTPAVDYYALGITLLACWTGGAPFGAGTHSVAELFAFKQLGRVPMPDTLPEEWKRLVRALLAVDPSQRLDYAGVQRWLRGEPIAVPEAPSAVRYPELVFRTDRGASEGVTDPARLAALFEANPASAPKFLYGGYVKHMWSGANPGLCAALDVLVEDTYPRDQPAGVAAAVYVLDPERPYRDGDSVVTTYTELATHLEQEAATYRFALRAQTHKLWLYLAARPDPRVQEGVGPLMTAFKTIPSAAANHTAAASIALHHLALWLRALDGEQRLPFAGIALESPSDLLALPSDAQADAALRLADGASLLSVWTAASAPGVVPTLARWRARCPGDVTSLAYALGAGVPVGSGEIRNLDDALNGEPAVLAAMWNGNGDIRRAVERYLDVFHDRSLVEGAFDWLLPHDAEPHAQHVLAYVAAHLPDLLALVAPEPSSMRGDPVRSSGLEAERLIEKLASEGSKEDVAATWAALDSLVAGEPWRVLADELASTLIHVLATGVVSGDVSPTAQGTVLDAIADACVASLDASSSRVPLRLHRLGLWARTVSEAMATVSQGPVRTACWQYLVSRMNDPIAAMYRQGYQEIGNAPSHLQAANLLITHAVLDLRLRVPDLPFFPRYDQEEQAHRDQQQIIRGNMAAERTAALAKITGAEQRATDALRTNVVSTGPLSSDAAQAKRAKEIAWWLTAGALVYLLVSASLSSVYWRDPGVRFTRAFQHGLVMGVFCSAAAARLIGLDGVLAGAAAGAVGFWILRLSDGVAALSMLALLALAAGAWWRAARAGGRVAGAIGRVTLDAATRRQFNDQRAAVERQMRDRESAWVLATRRALALAPDPTDVDPRAVRAQLTA